jgi:dephospho-CoA kinase
VSRIARPAFPGFTVGVTGGIGSGKSAVCEILGEFGREVIAADPLARAIMETNIGVMQQLKKMLGEAMYSSDGNLDRARVASMIFGDRLLREKVNEIVHPRVFEAIRAKLASLPGARRAPYVVVEAALIYESGMDKLLDQVVVVDADPEIRIQRVMIRDSVTREEVAKRIRSQLSAAEKVRRGDIVIRNSGDRLSLPEKVRFVDSILRSLSQKN